MLRPDTPISGMWHRSVVGRVSWTVLDQSLLAIANFAASLVLARWLSPVDYGGYVSASALFWLVMNAHGGLLTEPMMVFGSGRFRDRGTSYLGILAVLQWGISAMISAGLAAGRVCIDVLGIGRGRLGDARLCAGGSGGTAAVAAPTRPLSLVASSAGRYCRRRVLGRDARAPLCAFQFGNTVVFHGAARRRRRQRFGRRRDDGYAPLPVVVVLAWRLDAPGRGRPLALWPLGGRDRDCIVGSGISLLPHSAVTGGIGGQCRPQRAVEPGHAGTSCVPGIDPDC